MSSRSFDNLSFESLAWASLFYHHMANSNHDEHYRNLLTADIVSTLRTNPTDLTLKEVRENIIQGFLNPWGCRLANNTHDVLAAQIIQVTRQIHEDLQSLNGTKLLDLDLDNNKTAIKNCYQEMANIGNRFSHTAASKLLHIINPELFVMWDRPMRTHCRNIYNILEGEEGYFEYMKKMQKGLRQVLDSFPRAKEECPAEFLSKKLGIEPPKTLVKYLDEYNWITITNNVILPPSWHP